MTAWTPSCLYVASSVLIRDIKQGNNVAHAKESLRFVLQTLRLFGRVYRNGQMFLAQLLRVMKKNNIELESLNLDEDTAPAGPKMNCDFEFLGPLWSTEVHQKSK